MKKLQDINDSGELNYAIVGNKTDPENGNRVIQGFVHLKVTFFKTDDALSELRKTFSILEEAAFKFPTMTDEHFQTVCSKEDEVEDFREFGSPTPINSLSEGMKEMSSAQQKMILSLRLSALQHDSILSNRLNEQLQNILSS